MRKKIKSVFWILLFATLTSGFTGDKETVSAKRCEAGSATARTEVATDTNVPTLEEEDDTENDGETGNFLKDLKKSIENLNKKNAETKLTTKDMELTMQCGFENMVKYGRNICIHSNITNNGDNFVGYMQIVVPSFDNDDNVMYQKEISIPAGETKNIMFPLAPEVVGYKYNVRIVDEQGKEVVAKELVPNFQYDEAKLFVGVLTDEKDYLGYLSQADIKVFYLNKDNLPDDEVSLDTLDIIVINNFNTGNLSQEQYGALKAWVNNGGSLVIGTGATGSKTLDVFKDDFISGTFGDIGSDGVMSLKLDDSEEISIKKAERSFYNVKKGLGNVLICSRDLGVEYNDWAVVGKSIVNGMKKQLRDNKSIQMGDTGVDSYYEIMSALDSTNQLKLPSVAKYALVLFIYIFITGPFLYLLLKKLDKRSLLWGMIPASAILFGVGIYALGSETRLDDPFVGYINFYKLDGSGKNQGEENIFFNITLPTNEKYTFELPETTQISSLSENYDMYNTMNYNQKKDKKDKWAYKTAINYGAEGTTVQLKDYSTFSSAYFKSRSRHMADGTYEYNLNAYKHKLSGNFKNNLGYDLERAMIVCDQKLYYLGDIENGKSIDMSTVKEGNIYSIITMDDIYNGDIISKIAGGDPYQRNVEWSVINRYNILEYMFNYKFLEITEGTKLIAFTEEESGDGFVKQMDLDCNGLRVVEIPLEIDRTNGNKEFIPNLDEYVEIIEGEVESDYRYAYTNEVLAEIQFEEEDNIKSISYEKTMNPDLGGYSNHYSYTFKGKIYFYNLNTKQYDLVIEGGQEKIITNLEEYLDKDNKLLLKYQANDNNEEMFMPILSAIKEVE